VQRFIKKSGLKYSMHSAGTTVGKTYETLMLLYQCTLTRARRRFMERGDGPDRGSTFDVARKGHPSNPY